MSFTSEMGAYVFGELLPFGDLVTDWLLVFQTDPSEEPVSWWILLVGSIVDSIPEVSLVLGFIVGVMWVLVGIPVLLATSEGKNSIKNSFVDLFALSLRHTLSDGKTLVRIFTLRTERENDDRCIPAATKLVMVFFSCVIPYMFFGLLGMVACLPLCLYDQFCNGAKGEKICNWKALFEHPFFMMFVMQILGGLMTEAVSLYLAIKTGKFWAILSSLLGLYSLFVGSAINHVLYRRRKEEMKTEAEARSPSYPVAHGLTPGYTVSGVAQPTFPAVGAPAQGSYPAKGSFSVQTGYTV